MALDKNRSLVIVENKFDNSGRDVTWQALKYASYCSRLSKEDIREIYQQYLERTNSEANAEEKLSDFFDNEDYTELNLNIGVTQRIILIAAKFPKEVTSTALWLRKFNIRLQCFHAIPYSKGDELYVNFEQIIPIQDVEDYMIGMDKKEQEEVATQTARTHLKEIRMKFWAQLIEQINDSECKRIQNINPGQYNWISASSGIQGVGHKFEVTKTHARAELYINRGGDKSEENELVFEELLKHKESIEKHFDGKLIWDKMEENDAYRIRAQNSGNVSDTQQWDDMKNFMVDSMIRLERALKNPLKEVDKTLKSKAKF